MGRIGRARSRAWLFAIARRADSAGMGRGAKRRSRRSPFCAGILSLPMAPWLPWSRSMVVWSSRSTNFTIRLSRCWPTRTGSVRSARPPTGTAGPSPCARGSNNAMPILWAAFGRIARRHCRNGRTRTCTSSRPRSLGSRSTMIRRGAAWRTVLCASAWNASSIARPARCARALLMTGRRPQA